MPDRQIVRLQLSDLESDLLTAYTYRRGIESRSHALRMAIEGFCPPFPILDPKRGDKALKQFAFSLYPNHMEIAHSKSMVGESIPAAIVRLAFDIQGPDVGWRAPESY